MSRHRARVRRLRGLLPAALLLGSYAVLAPSLGAQATSAPSVFRGATTTTRTAIAADGSVTDLDVPRTVHLTVAQTTDLRGRQQVDVSWSGAHPTGGIVSDVNSGDAAGEEYPLVLLECRGTRSGADAVTPQTCWTQTSAERYQQDNSTVTHGYSPWRSDRWASEPDRAASVDAPDPRPADCPSRPALAERWVPFDAVDGHVYPGGTRACGGAAPEASDVDAGGLPGNATYGVTDTHGRGSTSFDVWTTDENASLGCTATVACSLVAVPIAGISCDAYGTTLPQGQQTPTRWAAGADAACRAQGVYAPGSSNDPGIRPDLAVTGSLWWSASNWRNRIVVPLSFAPAASICQVVSDEQPTALYGSVLLDELSAQWEPTFCTSRSLHPFVHVQTSDAAARTLLDNGGIDAALSSGQPDGGFTRPLVQAPVAVTGFAVTYAVDDAEGRRYTKLRLDARLLAKLLTESYSADNLVSSNYPALAHNPQNLTKDPEFVALNPGLPVYNSVQSAATLSILSADADLMRSLTTYIDADPEARAWLNGQPDPWGMTVNPHYLGIALPVESWPLLDDFTLPKEPVATAGNPCYAYSPAPYLQLIANPTALLATIVQDVQFGISNSAIACPGGDPTDVSTLRLRPQGRQQVGRRFVLGLTTVSAAHRYDLDAAALQTTIVHPDLAARFADATGRTFVAPDDAGLRTAAGLLRADKAQHTWLLDTARVARTAGAYPGTMPVYADVPLTGLPRSTAAKLAQFLRYAGGPGQRPGTGNGELPAGYLPLTSAEGLGALASYTVRSADAVAAQSGTAPSLDVPTVAPPKPVLTPAPSAGGAAAGGAPAGPTGGGAPGGGTSLPGAASGPSATASAAAPSRTGTAAPAAAGPGTVGLRTVSQHSRLAQLTVPLLVFAALVLALAGVLLRHPGAPAAALGAVRQAAARRRRPS